MMQLNDLKAAPCRALIVARLGAYHVWELFGMMHAYDRLHVVDVWIWMSADELMDG